MPERWLPVVGYEGLYEVSDLGRVRRLYRRYGTGSALLANPQLMSPFRAGKGYLVVELAAGHGRKAQKKYIHRVVLEAFVAAAPEGADGAHEDGSRDRNALANLRWKSRAENLGDRLRHGTDQLGVRGPHAKLTEDQVRRVRAAADLRTAICVGGLSRSATYAVRARTTYSEVL